MNFPDGKSTQVQPMNIRSNSGTESQASFGHHFYSHQNSTQSTPINGDHLAETSSSESRQGRGWMQETPLDSIVLNCNTREKVLKYSRGKLTRDLKDALTVNGIVQKGAVKTCLKKSVSGATEVEIHVPKNHSKVTLKQVHTCKNFWQCPCCRTHALNRKRESVQKVIDRSLTENIMVTLTLRHDKNDSLKLMLDGLQKACSDLWRDRQWLRLKKEYQFLWNVRNLEVTWSEKNGWHSHIHLLIGCKNLSGAHLDSIRHTLFGAWNRLVQKYGLKSLDEKAGVNVIKAENADDYLVKWSISKEMASDKNGKKGHLSVGDMEIEVLCHTIDPKHSGRISIHQARMLLQEYYEAFDKRKFLQPGGKFNEILRESKEGESVDETEDETENEVLEDKTIIYVKGSLWSKLCYSGWGFAFLSKLEKMDIPEALSWLSTKWNGEELLEGLRVVEHRPQVKMKLGEKHILT